MKRTIGIVTLAISLALIIGFQTYTALADQLVTVTITEDQLNQRLVELLKPNPSQGTVTIVIERGQLSLNGKVSINGNTAQGPSFSFKIRPFISKSKIACVFSSAQFNGRFATRDDLHYLNSSINEVCDQLFSPFLSPYPNAQVTGIVLANHTMTLLLKLVGQPVAAGCSATMLGNVNLRSDPGSSASVITALPQGTTLPVIGTQGDWLQVSYRGTSGWVYAPLVSQTCT